MPDLLVEAQHSTVRIFEVKYAEDYEFEDWQSWGLGGYYSYSANLSTGEMANGRVQCYWGDGETPTIVNLNIETATTENPIVEYSDEAVSACFGVYTQKQKPFSPNKKPPSGLSLQRTLRRCIYETAGAEEAPVRKLAHSGG